MKKNGELRLNWTSNFAAGIFSAITVLVVTGQRLVLESVWDWGVACTFLLGAYLIGYFVIERIAERTCLAHKQRKKG